MKILEAELKNFGNFVDEKLSFHDGINVVWAKNGAGKSTIHEFILAMFYGLKGEECIRWQSWNGNGCLSGKLRFESGGKTYLLERDFLDGKNKGHLHCETDDQELSVEEDLPELLGNMSENAWKNTLYVTQRGPNIGKKLASELKNYLGNLSGKGHIDVSHAQEKLEKQQDELEWEKKQAQADLISRQQEIRMKMDYIEQDIERLKKEQEDSLESLRLLKEAKAREDQEFARKQEKEREDRKQVRNVVGLFIMLGAVLFAVAGIYVPPIWAKVLLFVGAILLGVTDYFYQRSRSRMLEAEAELFKARESLKKAAWKKKVDEQERLRWQLEKVKDSLREKQLDYENLRESVAELRSTDSRLDSIDEELKAVSQALLAIGEITREIYDESALKLNAFASGIMDEIVGKDFGELYLDQDMEICVRTGEQTLRLSDESYGTLSQVYFAARMAIGKTLSDRESMPIVLDDTFSMYDPERLLAVFRWLKKSGSQVILFTSRLLEAETAEKVEKE